MNKEETINKLKEDLNSLGLEDSYIDLEKEYDSSKFPSVNYEEIKKKILSKSNCEDFDLNEFLLKNPVQTHKLTSLFMSPKTIGVISDVNSGKSNFLYFIITMLRQNYKFNFYSYGLKIDLGERKIYSLAELEEIRNSIIIVDEFESLFDLEDRKNRKKIENTYRLIVHNNNILLICGVGENFKKFIASKLDICIFGKTTIGDLINGSRIKKIITGYRGNECGTSVLSLPKDRFLLYDGEHYLIINVPYLAQYDTKKENKQLLEKCGKNVPKNVEKIKNTVEAL